MANILQQITNKKVSTREVAPDILLIEFPLVNACLVGQPNTGSGNWVLVDAGTAHTAKDIVTITDNRFGKGNKPAAIVLTHGHFDHVGALTELINVWKVPVYAHELELPFLTGQQDYPPADPDAEAGLIAEISPTFPHKGINLGNSIQALPADGSIPGMAGWRWIHTPGHTPGHVSLLRESDRVLIAGDAITTLKQESAESVYTKEKEINGPPAYFTIDWQAARQSIVTIKNLNPSLVISSHGLPISGDELQSTSFDSMPS